MRKFFVFVICVLSGISPCFADFAEYVVPSGARFFVTNCNEIDLTNASEGERVDFIFGDDFVYGKFAIRSGAKAKGTITGMKVNDEGTTEVTLTEAVTLNGDKIPVAGKVIFNDGERVFPAGSNFEVILLRPVTVNPSVK